MKEVTLGVTGAVGVVVAAGGGGGGGKSWCAGGGEWSSARMCVLACIEMAS